VPATLDGERVDRAVSILTGRSRAEVARIVEAGQVAIGGVPVSTRSRRLVPGETLEVALADDDAGSRLTAARPESGVAFTVVLEDEDVVVVDKPAGVVVHPGAGNFHGTLVSGLLQRFPEIGSAGGGDAGRPGIVHRLDKGTSGLLVVARTPAAYRSLRKQIAEHSVSRGYLAVVAGHIQPDDAVIDAPVGRSRRDPTRMGVVAGGRAARTRYRVRERYTRPIDAARLELELDTGRTHQIRVHLAAVGHPVLGDERYGGLRKSVGLSRPFLHASRLAFTHPRTGLVVEAVSPLPADLAGVLEMLS
jgi:23S rRNA pseudouridine1911/1915/1917 synthase